MLNQPSSSPTPSEEELQQLENLQRRWMIGSDEALDLQTLPSSWQPLIERLPTERHSLMALALASQYQSIVLTEPEPTDLFSQENLPDLAMPVISENLRGLFRRIILKPDINPSPLLRLLLQRGYIAHPADWLPSAKENNLPEIYLPWSHWVAKGNQQGNNSPYGKLTADNWDQWYPAQRIAALKEMRFIDPADTRALITTCAANEPAEKRVKIIQALSINLSIDDIPALQDLLKDRSQKIAHLAAQFLARLGSNQSQPQESEAKELVTELAATYEIKKSGLFKKKKRLSPLKLKSKKQQALRSEQLEKVSLIDFATALQIDINELASSWEFTNNRFHDNHAFITNAVNTLPDSGIEALLENLLANINSEDRSFALLQLLQARLSNTKRSSLMLELLQQRNTDIDFSDVFTFLDAPIQHLDWSALQTTEPWKTLIKSITENLKDNGYIDNYFINSEIITLGLFLPQNIAEKVLNHLTEIGMLGADPILDCLKLNTQLIPSS
jgi:hypothetical protein